MEFGSRWLESLSQLRVVSKSPDKLHPTLHPRKPHHPCDRDLSPSTPKRVPRIPSILPDETIRPNNKTTDEPIRPKPIKFFQYTISIMFSCFSPSYIDSLKAGSPGSPSRNLARFSTACSSSLHKSE